MFEKFVFFGPIAVEQTGHFEVVFAQVVASDQGEQQRGDHRAVQLNLYPARAD